MIKLTSGFVNETIVLQHILPDKEHMSHLMDTVVNKFYIIGRGWITTQVRKVYRKEGYTYLCRLLLIGCKSSTTSC